MRVDGECLDAAEVEGYDGPDAVLAIVSSNLNLRAFDPSIAKPWLLEIGEICAPGWTDGQCKTVDESLFFIDQNIRFEDPSGIRHFFGISMFSIPCGTMVDPLVSRYNPRLRDSWFRPRLGVITPENVKAIFQAIGSLSPTTQKLCVAGTNGTLYSAFNVS